MALKVGTRSVTEFGRPWTKGGLMSELRGVIPHFIKGIYFGSTYACTCTQIMTKLMSYSEINYFVHIVISNDYLGHIG